LTRSNVQILPAQRLKKTSWAAQARAFLLRSGMLGLRLWVKVSESRRERHLRALSHRTHTVLHAQFKAWKNISYPLGLRTQRRNTIYPLESTGGATKGTGRHHEQGTSFLEMTEAARLRALENSSGYCSLDLLRLPMIGWRMRRVLYAWRKLTEKETRFRYIKDILPQTVRLW